MRDLVDQVSPVQGHSANGLLAIRSPPSRPHGVRAFPVARQRRSVREWNVSSEPALRRPPRTEASAAPPSGRAQEASSASRRIPLAPPASSSSEGARTLPLRFDEVFRRYAPYVGALVLKLI